jgi:type IV pilus assembly protein PilA
MKNHLLRTVAAGLALLAMPGCSKKEEAVAVKPEPPKPQTVELVKASERSRHFLAVQPQLELGGTLYAYADVDGDVLKFADSLRAILEQLAASQPAAAPFVKQDYRALFTKLGFDDIKAFGLSSVPEGDGYFRNRAFFLTPAGRHGLLAGLGGAPAPFAKLGLAPAGTDLYSESELDLAEVYKTVKAVVAQVGGETSANAMEDKIRQAGEAATISLLGLINGWKGHTAMVLRLDPEKTLTLPGQTGLVLPAPSILFCVDGIASSIEPLLKKTPALKVKTEGNRQVYSSAQPLPLPGLDPVIVIEGTTLYVATSPAFLDECLQHKEGLEQAAEFKEAIGRVGATGNGLVYASPKLFARLHDLERLNPDMPRENQQVLQLVLRNLPQPARPLVSVRSNLPQGILVRSYWNRSLKQDVVALAVYNPITIGVMAAMAIPAFEKVRTASQEKAVINNLRQLAAAADQYYLEKGVTTARIEDLVGPGKYLRRINPVDGEDYRTLVFQQGKPLRLRVPVLRKTVEYNP